MFGTALNRHDVMSEITLIGRNHFPASRTDKASLKKACAKLISYPMSVDVNHLHCEMVWEPAAHESKDTAEWLINDH
jgi:hypothetical protein